MTSVYVVERQIQDFVDAGGCRPGERMPTERELADRFGAARNTVRSAIALLESKSVLERGASRGVFVKALAESPDRVGHKLGGTLATGSPADVMEVRLVIEPMAAALAASRATPEQIRHLEVAHLSARSAADLQAFEDWDAAFHLAIFQAARNPLLIVLCETINMVRNQPEWLALKRKSLTPERRALYEQQHGDVLEAIRGRDANSARLSMHSHLAAVRANLLDEMPPENL